MKEVWKTVPSRPGLQASSFGRVRRLPKICKMPRGGTREYKSDGTYGHVSRSSKNAQHTYLSTRYRDLGHIKIHIAVCEAFNGPKPFNKAVVIHLDEDAHNNKPENLRWGTQKENLNSPKFKEYCRKVFHLKLKGQEVSRT
jgi:hypothetical protein